MSFDPTSAEVFRYDGFDIDPHRHELCLRYRLDGWSFEERVAFPGGGRWDGPAVAVAARLLFLLAGVSYYKTAAPPIIEVPAPGLTDAEARLLHAFYVDGLGEYAFRNGLDLTGLRIEADRRVAAPAATTPTPGRPLIPFGGGIDSIVTVEEVRHRAVDPALFVVGMDGTRFAAIEDAAAVTGLPVVRAERRIDPKVREAARLRMNFRNGHVPVTGVISAIAILAAALDDRDAVVMSNEHSASSGNVAVGGRVVNHQFSKSWTFEQALRAVLADELGEGFQWFSLLRPFSELWVAERMARLDRYLPVFRSCNRSFHIDPALRLDHWCGVCDKCAFIDLILAPFLDRAALEQIFGGREPLADEALMPSFRTLLGLTEDLKPFECVGDVHECRVGVLLAAARDDRRAAPVVSRLAAEVAAAEPALVDEAGAVRPDVLRALIGPRPPHAVPTRYAPVTLVG